MNLVWRHSALIHARRTTVCQGRFHIQRRTYSSRRSVSRVVPIVLSLGALTSISIYLLYPNASRSAPTSTTSPLSPSHFTPSTVLSNEDAGVDTKLLEVSLPPELVPKQAANDSSSSPFTPIWSVYIKDDDIQVERPFTPLEGVSKDGRMLFWVKKYPQGEVGQWLHSKTAGDRIDFRGPIVTWPWDDKGWDEVIMISGGTGITPFYQLFHSVISHHPQCKTRFTLLHSSRNPSELPPLRIMDSLYKFAAQHPDKFRLKLFVDSRDDHPHHPHLPPLTLSRIGKAVIEQSVGLSDQASWWRRLYRTQHSDSKPRRKILFLVCGPDPMLSAIAGPLGRNFSQGPIGGVLGEMGYASDEVWKL